MCPTFILPFLTVLVLVSSNICVAQYTNVHQYPAQWIRPAYPQQYQQSSPQVGINYPNIGAGLSSNYAGHIMPGYQPHYTMQSGHLPQPNTGSIYPQTIQSYPDISGTSISGHLPQPNTGSIHPQTIQSYPYISGMNRYEGAVPGATHGQFPASFSYPEYIQTPPRTNEHIHSGSLYPGLQQAKPQISVQILDVPIAGNTNPNHQNSELNLNELNHDRHSGGVLYPGLQQIQPNFHGAIGQNRHNLLLPHNQDITFENNYPALDSTSSNLQPQLQIFPGYNPERRDGDVDLMNVNSNSSRLFLPEDLNVPMIKHCPDYLRKYLENLKSEGRLEYPYSKTVGVSIIDICMPQKSGVVHFQDTTPDYDELSQEVDPE